MKIKRRTTTKLRVILLVPIVLAISCAALWLRGRKVHDTSSAQTPESASTELVPARSMGEDSIRAPRLAPALSKSSAEAEPLTKEGVAKVDARRMKRDQFYAEERRIMAKTWGLSAEKAADFEVAVHDMIQERKVVFDRLTNEKISPAEVAKGLRIAEEHSRQRLLEAIGPEHLLEYELMSGHFVEAGLDRKPFVPPKTEPAAAPSQEAVGVKPTPHSATTSL